MSTKSKETKKHVSIVISGHVDSGKSTSTGHLIYALGGIPERDMQKLKDEADRLGKGTFAFAFYMDTQKEERERGITIQCTTKEFYTESKHYTIIDAPGHKDFIKNMISGASQADVAFLLVPADGNFTSAIKGQSKEHALLLSLLGIKQLIIGINKMDSDVAKYSKERYDEIKNEMIHILLKAGWSKKFVNESVAFIPYSGYLGDNLIKPSTNMPWWTGADVKTKDGNTVHVHTVLDCLEKQVEIPMRPTEKPMRVPISGIYKIKGVGDVLTGRCEQGTLIPGTEVVFLPSHTETTPCTGKIFTVEMHHKSVPSAGPGDNVGMNIKGLDKNPVMPKIGDIMVPKSDLTIKICKKFTLQVKILNHPGELKVGYTPIGCVRTAKAPLKMTEIKWKMGKATGNVKIENPPFLTKNETAEVVFEPQLPFMVQSYKDCEGLSRVAILEGNGVVMIGKVISVEY